VIGGLADRAGARDLVDIPHDAQVFHGEDEAGEWCRGGITLARNQRQM
jgi:hypothetical protein